MRDLAAGGLLGGRSVRAVYGAGMTVEVLVVQHGEKERGPGDPGLTVRGRAQAQQTAAWVAGRFEVTGVWSSPLRRAVETARPLARAVDVEMGFDPRVRERMNWDDDGVQSLEEFLTDWERASQDRSHVPPIGDSSEGAGARFLVALDDMASSAPEDAVVAVVTHGGVTVDALRTLGGARFETEHPALVADGVPCCAITTLRLASNGWEIGAVASTGHLKATADQEIGR